MKEKCFYVVEFVPPKEATWFSVEATKRAALEMGRRLEKDGYRRVRDYPDRMEYCILRQTSYYHGA